MDSSNNVSTKDVVVSINNVVETTNPTITFKGLEYGIVTSPITGRQWLDRNLGATEVCTSSTDSACYGDYYQWGRLTNMYVDSSQDWTTDDSNGSNRTAQWAKIGGTGVCPIGFRVPTKDELSNETISYIGIDDTTTGAVKIIDRVTAFQNFLKFPSAGQYHYNEGNTGSVWTNSVDDLASWNMHFGEGYAFFGSSDRYYARSVRCMEGN